VNVTPFVRVGMIILVKLSAQFAQPLLYLDITMDDYDQTLKFRETYLQRLQLFLYLVPIFGFFPAVWTLYRCQGSRQQQRVSRLAITFTLLWLLAYGGLTTVSGLTSEGFALRVLYANALVTSGYFLTCFALMIKLWQHQSLRLPGVSHLAEKIVRQYLSEQKSIKIQGK
jgi:hypothetical protein